MIICAFQMKLNPFSATSLLIDDQAMLHFGFHD